MLKHGRQASPPSPCHPLHLVTLSADSVTVAVPEPTLSAAVCVYLSLSVVPSSGGRGQGVEGRRGRGPLSTVYCLLASGFWLPTTRFLCTVHPALTLGVRAVICVNRR